MSTVTWWHTAANPPCRPWCTSTHKPADFADGGLISCRARIDSDLAVLDYIEINACTVADEDSAANPGDLVHDAPAIEFFLLADGRDGDATTPEGLEALAFQLPVLLGQARALAASDPYATDEQKVFAR